jgi:uncharacterized FlaG/YvyC family protein
MSSYGQIVSNITAVSQSPLVVGQAPVQKAQPAANTNRSSPAPAVSSASLQAKLQQHLDETLKSTGFKAEIENERNGGMILRYVDSKTGQVLIQFPPQAVLDLVASIEIKEGLSPSIDAQSPDFTPESGAIIDQRA